MGRFWPRRWPRAADWAVLPAVLFALTKARCQVSWQASKSYLPPPVREVAEAATARSVSPSARQITRLVAGVGRRLPWPSTCLVNALAAYRLLRSQGIPSVIYMGVYKQEDQHGFAAHAWLTVGQEVLLGGPVGEKYRVIARLGEG